MANTGDHQKHLPAENHDRTKGKILAWSLWDWGSAAFNAVATTLSLIHISEPTRRPG